MMKMPCHADVADESWIPRQLMQVNMAVWIHRGLLLDAIEAFGSDRSNDRLLEGL